MLQKKKLGIPFTRAILCNCSPNVVEFQLFFLLFASLFSFFWNFFFLFGKIFNFHKFFETSDNCYHCICVWFCILEFIWTEWFSTPKETNWIRGTARYKATTTWSFSYGMAIWNMDRAGPSGLSRQATSDQEDLDITDVHRDTLEDLEVTPMVDISMNMDVDVNDAVACQNFVHELRKKRALSVNVGQQQVRARAAKTESSRGSTGSTAAGSSTSGGCSSIPTVSKPSRKTSISSSGI